MEEEDEEELGGSQSPDDGGSMKIAGGGDCRGRWGGERGLEGAGEGAMGEDVGDQGRE